MKPESKFSLSTTVVVYLRLVARADVELLQDLDGSDADLQLCQTHADTVTRPSRERHEVDRVTASLRFCRKPVNVYILSLPHR